MASPYIRMRHRSDHPCPSCGEHFQRIERRQKYCSVPCKVQAMRKTGTRVCVKCNAEKPIESFPKRPCGNRPKSCEDCYRPRGGKPKLLASRLVRNPCKQCGQRYYLRRSPSALKNRVYCSVNCLHAAQRVSHHTCQTCNRLLPYDAFGHQPSGRMRKRSCARCDEERSRLREQKMGYMQSLGRMKLQAITAARRSKVPCSLTNEELDAVYQTPCGLCAAPSCCLRRTYPELGFVSGNVSGECWLCNQIGTTKSGLLTDEVIIKHARAIVRRADALSDS